MRYRRLVESLRTQNWTAVAIDLVIVVVGVYIGIEVANWNTDRGDRLREAGLLREIAADLRQDRAEYAAGRKVALGRIAAANHVLEQARGSRVTNIEVPGVTTSSFELARQMAVPATPPLDAVDRQGLWTRITYGLYPQPSTTAFDSLLSAGDLGLIRNDALVHEIQRYRLALKGLDSTQDNGLRPVALTARGVGEAAGLAAFGRVDEAELVAMVRASRPLAATIESQLGWATIHIVQIDSADERAAQLLARLEAEATP